MSYKVGDKVVFKGIIEGKGNNYQIRLKDTILWLSENEINEMPSKTYSDGLNDAWELALKVSAIPTKGGIPHDDCIKMFGTSCGFEIIRKNTPQEALAKIEAYEESKAIKVGDVVKVDGTNKDCGIVIAIDEIQKKARLMYADTSFRVNEWYLADLKKTGRHLDISNLLEQIRGDS